MADEDELYYLQPGFDLNSLTVPRLRNILVAHGIAFPSSAKKGQLVEIVEGEILPKAKKLLRERDRVRRTSKGITDVPSSQDDTAADEELMPPPPVPKTPRSRKSKSNLTDATPSTSRRSKTPTSRKSSSRARQSDTETEGERIVSTKKTRKSTPGPTPVAPTVTVQEPRSKREAGSSPFSDDNPFQSGSSPTSGQKRLSSTSRSRKSTGRQSTSRRRDTASPTVKREDDGRATYQFPASDLPSDNVPVTEEFTPEASRELRQAEANGQLVPKRSQALVRRQKRPASTAAKATPVVVLTSVLAALAGWYRQEKVNIGYCGVGQPNWSLASNPNIPSWVHDNLQPQCEPCPPHAVCFPDMEVRCDTDFVLQQHPLNLGGLVPLPPTCEPDSEKEKRVKAVADKAVEELRERRADWECGDDLSTGSTSATLEIPEETLKQEVAKMRRKDMSPDQFEDLWRGALGDIMGRDEVEVTRDGSGRVLLSSNSLAKLPISCALRRWTIRTLAAYRIPIALLITALSAAMYGRQRLITYQEATAQIPGLVDTALDRLATQAALKEDGRGDGFISVGQLRDDVLRKVFSVRERERVWENVRKIVEGNSNVRAATREGGKTGEWSRVWEWIGPVDMAPGLEGRKSGLLQNSPQNGQPQELEIRKWDEGRPIY